MKGDQRSGVLGSLSNPQTGKKFPWTERLLGATDSCPRKHLAVEQHTALWTAGGDETPAAYEIYFSQTLGYRLLVSIRFGGSRQCKASISFMVKVSMTILKLIPLLWQSKRLTGRNHYVSESGKGLEGEENQTLILKACQYYDIVRLKLHGQDNFQLSGKTGIS